MALFRLNCVNRFLTIDDPLFVKWGRPNNLGTIGNGDFNYQCLKCLASWVGPNGDYCDWCHKRWLMVQADNKRKLLFPEWLEWGDQYYQLGKVSREVWANTRGYSGNFLSPWLARIEKAQTNGEISEVEFVAAFKRCTQWINRMP
jgi:hypothetical protein